MHDMMVALGGALVPTAAGIRPNRRRRNEAARPPPPARTPSHTHTAMAPKQLPPHIVAGIKKWAPWAFAGLAWLVTLGGVAALQSDCIGSCPSKTGLTWWSLIWQACVLAAAAFAFFGGAKSTRVPVAIMAGLSALLAMILADRHLNDAMRRVTRFSIASGASVRTDGKYDATAAGLIMTALANLGLLTCLTVDWAEVKDGLKAVKLPEVTLPKLPKRGGAGAGAGAAAAV